jgi:hypothetical protein
VEEGGEDRSNHKNTIFVEALIAIYGPDVFYWVNEKLQ